MVTIALPDSLKHDFQAGNFGLAADCTITAGYQDIEVGYNSGYVYLYFGYGYRTTHCGGTLGSTDTLTINLTSGDDFLNVCRDDGDFGCQAFAPESGDFADVVIYCSDGDDHVDWSPSDIPASIYGEDGDDTLTGGLGDDYLYGDDGCDTLRSTGAGADTMFLGSLFASDGCTGTNWVPLRISATSSEDGITVFGSMNDDYIAGTGGDDYIWGGSGDDSIVGLYGVDVIDGGPGDDWITGGISDDEYSFSSGGGDLIIGNLGSDVLIGSFDSGDCLCGFNCYSSSSGSDGWDTMIAWEGNDYLCDANTYDIDSFDCGGGTDKYYVSNLMDPLVACETYSSVACSYCRNWATESSEAGFDYALSAVGITKPKFRSDLSVIFP